MKKINLLFNIVVFSFLFMATTCEDDNQTNCEEQLASLANLKLDIENLASTSICNETFECRYIGFGSKPCGGPWGYLVYSTSIDTLMLEDLVTKYYAQENNYNTECGSISDCSVPQPPIAFDCSENKCVPIY